MSELKVGYVAQLLPSTNAADPGFAERALSAKEHGGADLAAAAEAMVFRLGQEREHARELTAEIERLQNELAMTNQTLDSRDRNIADLAAENIRLRALLLRQYKADAACYATPFGCTEAEHIAVLSEHDAVHALLAAEFKA